MNKQEAIKTAEFRVIYPTEVRPNLEVLPLEEVKNIISQIDEPQKVVVPKFVADWIEKYKEMGCRLANALDNVFDDVELSLYIKQQDDDYTEIIAKAWLAYPNITVEQEKLYTVEIPNPNRTTEPIIYLSRDEGGKIFLNSWSLYVSQNWKNQPHARLTEAEIKQDFEWTWNAGFAKPVEEK